MSLRKIALLILLAAGARPAYSGSTSGSTTLPAPATAPAGAAASSAGVSTGLPPTTTPALPQPLSRFSVFTTGTSQGSAPVLVIPAQDMPPETYDRIVEDLSIMSRIIEKSLRNGSEQGYAGNISNGIYGENDTISGQMLFLPSDGSGPRILRSPAGRPKAIYIGGYGAVFSFQVSFPLVPPPETAEPNKTTDKTDRVWAAAQQELVNPQAALRMRTGGSQGRPYRPEAVENLRSTLLAVLKHASNIRDLEPESWLTILVQGPSTAPDQSQDFSGDQPFGLIGTRPTGRTLLTLRARKADIDQLAKGLLEQIEFQKRVQITTY